MYSMKEKCTQVTYISPEDAEIMECQVQCLERLCEFNATHPTSMRSVRLC